MSVVGRVRELAAQPRKMGPKIFHLLSGFSHFSASIILLMLQLPQSASGNTDHEAFDMKDYNK